MSLGKGKSDARLSLKHFPKKFERQIEGTGTFLLGVTSK